jgi:copper(I)-binding protein
VIRSRAAVALAVSLVAVLPTAGCYQGFDNTVNTQGPTGNGTDFRVGDGIKVQDATLVTGPAGESGVASLVMSIINEGELPDALVTVTTEPATTSSQKSPIAIKPGTSVRVGGPTNDQIVLTGLKITPGSYATVTVSFERAGSETRKVAVVPAVGYYEGYGPAAAVAK